MVREKFKPQVAGSESYLMRFQNSDLVENMLVIQHNLRVEFPVVMVYDESNKVVIPDDITWLDEDRIELDLTSFAPISGIWHARVVKD